jgi:Na+-transporting methylmalonyl-CoA/oxaloacetate decarboxylase gamma subunit
MVNNVVLASLQIYGIAIVIAMLVAVLIKALVIVTSYLEKSAAPSEAAQSSTREVFDGVPEEDVAALSAAIFAVIGPHRILHIADTSHAWSSHGRAAQHTSHAGVHRPMF